MLFYSQVGMCTKIASIDTGIKLYRHLLRLCRKLPNGPKEHYTFMIKQSFKQHRDESDPERVKQMISKSLNDADWIIKKLAKMFKVPLSISDQPVSRENFWLSVFLYHSNPHLVNRRLLGVSQILWARFELLNGRYKKADIFSHESLLYQLRKLAEVTAETVRNDFMHNLLEFHDNCFSLRSTTEDAVKSADCGQFISVRLLIPREACKAFQSIETVLFDKNENIATFHAVSLDEVVPIAPPFPYNIGIDKGQSVCVCVSDFEIADSKSAEWLANQLFPKIFNWIENCGGNKVYKESLRLVPKDKYCLKYQTLKVKYGHDLVKNWSEKTDPQKFVFEDIAIASYLLVLWEERCGNAKQTFIDIGCGNGLLVYVLSQEGHQGLGIDLRPRKIWTTFPETTKLEIREYVPSSSNIFPAADWIIGNHSDELTPWIPIIAARSSASCNFFLLPCCPFDFDGKRYQRRNSAKSQYEEYLEYVQKIGETCGFEAEIDKLRIPSTKRTCIVGTKKGEQGAVLSDGQVLKIVGEFSNNTNFSDGESWCANFTARPAKEPVRNCTQLEKNLVQKILRAIVALLIEKNQKYLTKSSGEQWNAGGDIHLSVLAQSLPQEMISGLKKECGGLQTLLRNNHSVFSITNGNVCIKSCLPSELKRNNEKTKKCWFIDNHPDGCLFSDEECNYMH